MVTKTLRGLSTIFFALTVSAFPSFADEAYNHASTIRASNVNWMERIDGYTALSDLSIPGTHDTMASKFGGDMALTQSLNILSQLNAGIRVLDIRLKCQYDATRVPEDRALYAWHGIAPQYRDFGYILDNIKLFLNAHPSETVYAIIKNEDPTFKCKNNTPFVNIFDLYFQYYQYQYSLFWTPSGDEANRRNPTLNSTRGKLVILPAFTNDNSPSPYGINYRDTSIFDIQDSYELKYIWELHDRKWFFVKSKLNAAKDAGGLEGRTKIYFNYLSGAAQSAAYIILPYFVASGQSSHFNSSPLLLTGKRAHRYDSPRAYPDFPLVNCNKHKTNPKCDIAYYGTNKLTLSWLQSNQTTYTGILMMDFPGTDLINKIISYNDRYKR